MNKKFTKLFAALALLMFLIPLTGWGQTRGDYSYTFTAKVFDANNQTKTLNEVDWAFAGTLGGSSAFFGYDGTKGQQFGSGSNPFSSFTLSTSDIDGTITEIIVNTSGASSIAGTLNVTVGGNAFGDEYTLTKDATDVTFTGSASGEIVFNYAQSSSKAFYIKSISVTYTTGGGSDPEIQIAADELQLPYTANSDGHFNVTYTNDFEPSTAFAKLYNDAQGEVEFDGDWIELIDEDLSDLSLIEYGVQANTGTSVRTVYLYVEAMDESTNVINAMFTITQAAQPTYTVTYAPNGGSGTMTDPDSPYHAGDVVVLMASTFTAPEGMIWDSWLVKDADDNEVEVDEGMFEMPASNVTVTAQWVTDPSGPQYEWVLTPLADLTEDDVFVIVGTRTDATYGGNYAMTNNGGTQDPPTAFAVTIANDKLSSAPADNLKWNISGNATDGYTFYPNGSTENWLYCTNTNNGVRVGTNTNKTFTINSGYLYHDGTSRHVGIFNNQDWRCYSPQNGNVHNNIANQTFAFYKRQVASDEPSITLASYEVEVNANAHTTPTTIAVTYANIDFENDFPEVVFYEQDGSTEAIYDWLFVDLDADWNVYYTVEENTSNVARTAYFKVLGYDSNANNVYSNLASITQAAAPVVYTTIPGLFAAATSTATPVTITFNNWVISAVKGSNAYLTDNAGNGLIIYQSSHGFNVNDVLSGTASCNLVTYQGSAELTALTASTEGLTVTAGGTVTEQNIAINELGGVNTGALLAYENLTFNGTALVDADNNAIEPYSTLYSYTFEADKVYNIKGVYLQYNTTKEILPRSADDIEEVVSDEPSITVTPNNQVLISGDAGSGQLEVVYHKVKAEVGSVEFVWCNADGTTPPTETYELWLNANLDDEDVTVINYTVGDNDGPARTAYFKIVGLAEDTEEVVESVVSFTQHQFKPDYAYLPYEFNGGRADIENENGLTQEGLGSDYSSNNTKLRFDNVGDCLVLKINPDPLYEYSPKAITFDIKGNGFTGGTFSVQTSEDGETYTDLAAYTDSEITSSNQTFTLLNTNDNVKYIKWVYTYKSGGNIGLGNIYVDDEYLVRGNATVSEDLTLDECTIKESGKLTIKESGTLNVTNALTNEATSEAWNNLIIEDGGQLITTNAVAATLKKNIRKYEGEKDNYYLIATPVVAGTNAEAVAIGTYDLYSYDEPTHYWMNAEAEGATLTTLTNGTGYLYANAADQTLEFVGTMKARGSHPTASLTAQATELTGFNLVGNPFPCNLNINDLKVGTEAVSTIYQISDTEIGEVTVAQNTTIAPAEGFFVVATEGGTLHFEPQTEGSTANAVSDLLMEVRASERNAKLIDRAYVNFNQGSNVVKFQLNEANSKLYIPQGSKDYAVVRSQGEGELPVNFKADKNGAYTLSIRPENVEMDYLHLIDNLTGAEVDLLATPTYTFNAKKTDYASRFRLVFSTTGVEENGTETNASFAFFNGSEWVVNASDNATLEVIDMMGRTVLCKDVARNVSTNGWAQGVYVLRLVDGNSVKTQKIVVR